MEPILRIYFTSDVHGHYYPVDYASGKHRDGGLFHILSQYQKDGNTLMLDGGDALQGSPLVQRLMEAGVGAGDVARAMNLGQYDYVALGNHDFNYGYDFLASYLAALDARCLCCNITDQAGKLPILPSAVHTMENGLRVGLVGVCTDWVTRWEQPGTTARFSIQKVMDCLPAQVAALREQADLLVGIYHGGFEVDPETLEPLTDTDENIAFSICRQLDLDLLLTGHQHKYISGKEFFGTHAVQPGAYGLAYALVEVYGEKGHFTIQSRIIPARAQPHRPAYDALLAQETATQQWLDQALGTLPKALLPDNKITMALHGSKLADFCNQLQLDYTHADAACCSLLNDVRGLPKTVTRRDVIALCPFPGSLVVRRVTGKVLRAALERTAEYFDVSDGTPKVSRAFLEPKVEHYHFDFFYGIDYGYDLTKPLGSRVAHLRFQGRDLGPEDTLNLCLTNYRSSGTGGYDMYLQCPIVAEHPVDGAELLTRWLKEHPGGA